MSTYSYVDTILHAATPEIKTGSPDAYTFATEAPGCLALRQHLGLQLRAVTPPRSRLGWGNLACHRVHLLPTWTRSLPLAPHPVQDGFAGRIRSWVRPQRQVRWAYPLTQCGPDATLSLAPFPVGLGDAASRLDHHATEPKSRTDFSYSDLVVGCENALRSQRVRRVPFYTAL